jgi:geranylgeranyl pyrophosphate synthase
MRHALQECGAQAATLEAARSATRQALEALELSRPQDPAAGLLRDLSHQLIGRQH